MSILKNRILFLFYICFFVINQTFSQNEVNAEYQKGVLLNNVCWAKQNVDEPGSFTSSPKSAGKLYLWNQKTGWSVSASVIGENAIASGNHWDSTNDPCPAGWRIPTIDETKSLALIPGSGMSLGTGPPLDGFYWFRYSQGGESVYFPIFGHFSDYDPITTSKYGYWSSSGDTDNEEMAWSFGFYYKKTDAHPLLVPRDYALFVRCVKEKCDTIVENPFVTIFPEDLPYKWGDTTFQVGTESGIYRFQQSNCAFNRTVNLHLTVKPCLGVLINGVCWAEYNVDEPGTFANPGKPYGMLYQWNRKKGWPAITPDSVAGWDSSLEPGDTWEPANDPCPAGWRMPTVDEIETLLDETKVTFTNFSGQDKVLGVRYTDIATGNMLFLPITGWRDTQGFYKNAFNEHYWSGTDHWTLLQYGTRHYPFADACPVRCVADENTCDIVLTASENICKEKLPYTWRDTTFLAGTTTGEYRILRTDPSSGCDSIFYLYLTVDTLCGRPCKERGVLVNGVCWAESNVDSPNTFAGTPESFGLLYQWNRKKGVPLQGEVDPIDWWNYEDSFGTRWKAINNPCPAEWRIPTLGEIYTLLDEKKVSNIWTQQSGIDGVKFTDKVSGNVIFLPKAGRRDITQGDIDVKAAGYYWSATLKDDARVYTLWFFDDKFYTLPDHIPTIWPAYSVRCVAGRDTTDCNSNINTYDTICANALPYGYPPRPVRPR